MYYIVKSTRCSRIQENFYLHDHSLQFSILVGVDYGFMVDDGVTLVCNILGEQVTRLHYSNNIKKKQIRKITSFASRYFHLRMTTNFVIIH